MSASLPGTAPAAEKLHQHLRRLLKVAWKDYQRSLTRCRKKFSEGSVHQLRVESRRLLALLDLLHHLAGQAPMDPCRRRVKKLLRRFATLRDTQVHRLEVEHRQRAFPGVQPFRRALEQRERRLVRRASNRIHRVRIRGLKHAMTALRQGLRSPLADAPHEHQHWDTLLAAVNRAFGQVATLRDRCRARNIAAIHRLRIAFKRFRYMVELLQPILPGVPARQLKTLHTFQTRLGEIQDSDVLLAAVEKFRRKHPETAGELQAFRDDVERRRDRRVSQLLARIDQLDRFWPPPSSPSR